MTLEPRQLGLYDIWELTTQKKKATPGENRKTVLRRKIEHAGIHIQCLVDIIPGKC